MYGFYGRVLSKKDREERDKHIIDLYNRGSTKKQISILLGISYSLVNRTIRGQSSSPHT